MTLWCCVRENSRASRAQQSRMLLTQRIRRQPLGRGLNSRHSLITVTMSTDFEIQILLESY
jgi:hypothetical protein